MRELNHTEREIFILLMRGRPPKRYSGSPLYHLWNAALVSRETPENIQRAQHP